MTFILSTVYLFGMACSSNADPVPRTLRPAASPTPTADSSAKSSEGLPDLKRGLSKEGCDNGYGVMGRILLCQEAQHHGRHVRGEEWILFANKNGSHQWWRLYGAMVTVWF